MPTVHLPLNFISVVTEVVGGDDSFALNYQQLPAATTPGLPANLRVQDIRFRELEEPSFLSQASLPTGTGAPIPVPTGGSMLRNLGCCSCSCCVTIHVFCSVLNIAGATVTITGNGIDVSGTTDSNGNVKLCVNVSGYYTVTVAAIGYTTSVTNQLIVCSKTIQIGMCFQVPVYVFACSFGGNLCNAPCPPTSISIAGGGTGVTSSASCCALVSIPVTGTYTITATWNGQTAVQTVACGSTSCGIWAGAGFGIWIAQVFGCVGAYFGGTGPSACNGGLAGATVTIADIDAPAQTTDDNGCIQGFLLPPGTYSYTITCPRFQDVSGSFTIVGGGPTAYVQVPCASVVMSPAAGYACACVCGCVVTPPAGWNIPISTTLVFTDSRYGSCDLIFNGLLWVGTLSMDISAYCCCPGATALAQIVFPIGSFNGEFQSCFPCGAQILMPIQEIPFVYPLCCTDEYPTYCPGGSYLDNPTISLGADIPNSPDGGNLGIFPVVLNQNVPFQTVQTYQGPTTSCVIVDELGIDVPCGGGIVGINYGRIWQPGDTWTLTEA